MSADDRADHASQGFDKAAARARIAARIGEAPHDVDRRRRRATVGLGVLGVGALALAGGLTAAAGAGSDGSDGRGGSPVAAPTTETAPPAGAQASSPPVLFAPPAEGAVQVVPAAVLLTQSAAALDASPDAISQVTHRTSSYSDGALYHVVETRSTVAADGGWTLNERLTDLEGTPHAPLEDLRRAPGTPAIGAWGVYERSDGTWSTVSVDRGLAIWSTEVTAGAPTAYGSGLIGSAVEASLGFRDLVDHVLSGGAAYEVVEGSEAVQVIDGIQAVCVDYVVPDSWSPTEFDRHGTLCVDPVSGLPRQLLDVYSKGGPDRPEGYRSDEVSTFASEQTFGWYASTPENEHRFDLSVDGLTEVSPAAFAERSALFPTS